MVNRLLTLNNPRNYQEKLIQMEMYKTEMLVIIFWRKYGKTLRCYLLRFENSTWKA